MLSTWCVLPHIVRRHIGDVKVCSTVTPCYPCCFPYVTMILEGPSIKSQRESTSSRSSSSIALCINGPPQAVPLAQVRHATTQETPVPNYIGLKLHTRKWELVDRLVHKGISISNDQVLSLSTQLGNSACRLYDQKEVICSPNLNESRLFTRNVSI